MERERTEPYDEYEKLRERLIDCIPDFKLRLKVNPQNNRLVFSADVNSVFDIAWYVLARMMSEDPAPEDFGKEGKLPFYRAGKRYKFKISEVDEWVRNGKITE